jgi:hypothetical protein
MVEATDRVWVFTFRELNAQLFGCIAAIDG